jgi:hypothetical protein
MDKIKLVVFNEHTLGYILPEQPERVCILHTSILKGSYLSDSSTIYVTDGTVRLATEEDFNSFRVSFEGYEQDPNYEYAKS